MTVLHEILDTARWAPSGDNGQPWFITIHSPTEFSLDLTRFHKNAYNLIPMPDYISCGMFLENASIAAQQHGHDVTWEVRGSAVYASLSDGERGPYAALYSQIPLRSVNRFPYARTPLTETLKQELAAVLDSDIAVHWLESDADRWKAISCIRRTTDIRLRIPETYAVHSAMVDWSGADSIDRMPASSLGLNALSQKMMRFALASECRNRRMLALPGSTLSFQLELDIIPGMMCAAHFVLAFRGNQNPTVADHIRAGANMQRFWLALSAAGVVLQPWYIPVMFSRYAAEGITFTSNARLQQKAVALQDTLVQNILTPREIALNEVFFTGRVGYPKTTPAQRSVRKPLGALVVRDETAGN